MKKLFFSSMILTFSLVSLFSVSSLAQSPDKNDCQDRPAQKQCQKFEGRGCSKDRTDDENYTSDRKDRRGASYKNLVRGLDLSREQGAKIRPIVNRYSAKDKALRKSIDVRTKEILDKAPVKDGKPELTQAQKDSIREIIKSGQQEHKANIEEFKKEIAPILTSEQNEKLQARKADNFKCERRNRDGRPGQDSPKSRPHKKDIEKDKSERLVKCLELTSEQQTKLKEILNKDKAERIKLSEEYQKKLDTRHEATADEIETILDDTQKAKFTELRKECKKFEKRHAKQMLFGNNRKVGKAPKVCKKSCKKAKDENCQKPCQDQKSCQSSKE